MNLYKISQKVNERYGTYDSAIVAATSKKKARATHPGSGKKEVPAGKFNPSNQYGDWAAQDDITVEFVGIAERGTKPGVIVASYNAG